MRFRFPRSWIATGLALGLSAFGALPGHPIDSIQVIYRYLEGEELGEARPPATIVIDKRGVMEWTRPRAECVIAHEYGHLAGREHSSNPRSIMASVLSASACRRFLRRHGL